MRHVRRLLAPLATLALVALLAPEASSLPDADEDSPPLPRSVILCIGDGMGPSQVTLGRMVAGTGLSLDAFPDVGLVETASSTHGVTDSAAAATALATGLRTRNQAVSVDPETDEPLRTLLEAAEEAGYRTGLVTNSRITHATPAAFYAHVPHRNRERDIARALLDSGVEVALGGGRRNFSEDLRARFVDAGWALVDSADELERTGEGPVLGLFSDSHMAYEMDRAGTVQPSLDEMALRAVELLSGGDRPFFLMVEGARIDHACHAHDAPAAAKQMVLFDQTVGMLRNAAHDIGETLVAVTADHACGGMAISENVDLPALRSVEASSGAVASAVHDAEDLDEARLRLRELTGVGGVSPEALRRIRRAEWPYGPPLMAGHVVSRELGVAFFPVDDQEERMTNTHGHDASDVAIYADGPGRRHLRGTHTNAAVGRILARILDLEIAGTPEDGHGPRDEEGSD